MNRVSRTRIAEIGACRDAGRALGPPVPGSHLHPWASQSRGKTPHKGGNDERAESCNRRPGPDFSQYTGPRRRHRRLEQHRHGRDEGGQRGRQSVDAQHGPGERVHVRRGQLGAEPIFALHAGASNRPERLGRGRGSGGCPRNSHAPISRPEGADRCSLRGDDENHSGQPRTGCGY